jgi:hypothetical protein
MHSSEYANAKRPERVVRGLNSKITPGPGIEAESAMSQFSVANENVFE